MLLNLCYANIFRPDLNKYQIGFSVALLITCVFNLIWSSSVVYEIDDWSQVFSTSLTVLQSRVVAIATFMSRAAVLYDIRFNKYRKYRTTLEGFEIYCPTTAAATNRCRLFTMATVSMCLTCMLSTNCVKLYNLYAKHSDGYFVTTYFLFFYMQNCSIYLMESYFTHQCFMVYTAFREINGDLENVKRDTTDYARFPFLLDPRAWFPSATPSLSSCTVVYENDFYRPRDKGNPLANTVEFIKIKHWLIREAVTDLNDLFRIHLAISVVCLSVLMLFDVFIYFTATIDVTIFRSKFLFIGWLLQYSVRFFVLSITTNITTKQAIHSKDLINDINNRFLDTSTKEELQLFYNQVTFRSSEFTAYGLFTLNTRLITSAIAAGATYLIILLQLHS